MIEEPDFGFAQVIFPLNRVLGSAGILNITWSVTAENQPIGVSSDDVSAMTGKHYFSCRNKRSRLIYFQMVSFINVLSLHHWLKHNLVKDKQLRWPSGKSVCLWSCRLGFGSKSDQTNDFQMGILFTASLLDAQH